MASTAPALLPHSNRVMTFVNLSDFNDFQGQSVTFTFPQKMVADPLTSNGPGGSQPDNKATWWPYFQERHKNSPLYWVQGHMLNHNVHGPGTPDNLVPISNTLNTNMSAMVEEKVKALINAGHVLRYTVEAHWEGDYSTKDPTKHPQAMRRTYGIAGVDPGGQLNWGEHFAPTRLSWEVAVYSNYGTPGQSMKLVDLSRYGQDASQWNNHFPS